MRDDPCRHNPVSRRDFLRMTGTAGLALWLPGCATSPPLDQHRFPRLDRSDLPFLGLATSLRTEGEYTPRLEGTLPLDLHGTLYRIGPALFDRAGLRKRTLLDGDGMVQSFRFDAGAPRYRNRFVRTARFVEEEAAGRFIHPGWSTQAPGGLLANFWQAGAITSQANVTVYLHNGRLYAFDEGSLPYELDPESLATVGQSSLGLPRDMTVYAAHAKIDPITGEWLHFGVRYGPDPELHITVFDRHGALRRHRQLPMPRYVYMHDWFVTERHLIFNLQPLFIHFWGFLLGLHSLTEGLAWEPDKGNLLMVMERDGDAPPLFLETEASFMWHGINAREREGDLVVDFVGYDEPDHFIGPDPPVRAVMRGEGGSFRAPGLVRRFTLDLSGRKVRQEVIAGGNGEWPRINELHRCRAYRHAYLVQALPGEFFWSTVMRVDMETGRTASYSFGSGRYCSEPVFVPLPGRGYRSGDEREEGWLLTEVYDGTTRRSFLAVLRADRLEDGPVALVHLTHHAPFSFHGWWHPAG